MCAGHKVSYISDANSLKICLQSSKYFDLPTMIKENKVRYDIFLPSVLKLKDIQTDGENLSVRKVE